MEALDRMFTAANVAMASASARRAVTIVPERVIEANGADDGAAGEDSNDPGALADEEFASHVLRSYLKKEYFACLNVRKPTCDDLGRAVWDVSEGELNRAFRRASLRVHPDKNSSKDARAAFDAIGATQKLFKDEIRRAEVLRKAAEEAFREKCKKDPELMRQRAKVQEKVDAEKYDEEMKKQREEARHRAAEAKAKAAAAKRRRRGADSEDEDGLERVAKELEEREARARTKAVGSGSDDDDNPDHDGVIGVKRKPKKRFMF